MDFKIDDELLSEFATLIENQSEKLNGNITSIKDSVDGFSADWMGDANTTFVDSCQKFYPVLDNTYTVMSAYGKIARGVADAASECISSIGSAIGLL